MNGSVLNKRALKIEYALPFVFGIILLFVFAFFDQTAENFEIAAEVIVCALLVLSGIIVYFLYKTDLLSFKALICLVLLCGFALRLGYALKIGYWQNQHDVESLNSSGHLSYIYYIYQNNALPATNDWQFSHPPLHHFIASLVIRFGDVCGFTLERSFENIQLLTVLYSSISMLLGVKICSEIGIKQKELVLCSLILAFFPGMFILAGSINNDMLMIMLVLSALLFLIKWYKSPSGKFALLCGLFAGLAMMTKVSAAIFAVAAAITVIIKFIIDKDLKFSKVLLHAVLFVALLLPLGLWHPIRNYLLFEQPLGFVAPIPVNNPLYTGDISIAERFILPFSSEPFDVYVDVWNEYNVWYYLLRNSLFGEYNFGNPGIAFFAVLANLILIILSLISCVYLLSKCKSIKEILPIFPFYVIQLVFFIYFNLSYPFGCSMDFRYIVPLFFIGVVFIGKMFTVLRQNDAVLPNIYKYSAVVSTGILVFSSVVIFI